jgi:hypothetical protein
MYSLYNTSGIIIQVEETMLTTVENLLSGSPYIGNNVIIEGRFGIVVPKATTAVRNFLTTCKLVDCS